MAIERRTERPQARVEVRDHPEAEEAISGDLLVAADALSNRAAVTAREREQRKCLAGPRPPKLASACLAQPIDGRRIPREEIQSWRDAVHAVNEKRKVNARIPPQRVPRRSPVRHRARQHREKTRRVDGRPSVEGDGAAALQDEITIR